MKKKELDTTVREAVISKYLNALNEYMKGGVLNEDNYDEVMNLYENDKGDVKVDMYFYTTGSGEEIFRLVGSKLVKNGLYKRSDERFYDVNLLFDYKLVNLLLFIFLRDTMHITKYNFAWVTNTYRLDKANFGKFYNEVLIYFL